MNIVLLGAPGAGKGTQAVFLKDTYNLKLVGTGDLFRKEISQGTNLGKKAESYVKTGKLVPDELVFDIIEENLVPDDWERGLIFDGFPRTVKQAQELERIISSHQKAVDKVLFIGVEDAVLVDRLVNRWICQSCKKIFSKNKDVSVPAGICPSCGGTLAKRADDTPETVKKRLKEYKEKTEPILDYYGSKVWRIDGSLNIEEVTQKLVATVGV